MVLIIVGHGPPPQNRTANAGRSQLCLSRCGERLKQIALRANNADLAREAHDLSVLAARGA
jgi:hypothetical protein